MASEELDRWLAGLRGQQRDDADAAAGLRVRELVRERRADDVLPTAIDEQAWQRLQFRLRRERLLEQPNRRRYYALAASLAIAALGILVLSNQEAPSPVESQVWRGGEAPQRIINQNPKATADRIENILAGRKLLVRRTAEGNAIRLQAQLEANDRQNLEVPLAAEGIRVPAHGRLDIFIAPLHVR